jgi:signal transduction histidine kinase
VGLLGAAVRDLGRASLAVVDRERARAESPARLMEAGRRLAAAGGPILAIIPDWPETLDPIQWASLDEWLASGTITALEERAGLAGGYFLPQENRYLGVKPRAEVRLPISADLIDPQVREAWRRDQAVWLTVERSGQSIGLRAEPIRVNERRLAVVWVVLTIDDAFTPSRILALYGRSTRLALGGLALAAVLSVLLAVQIRHQAAQQRVLQAELRRSERLAALGRLLAGVAHEVRNPLAGLRSTAQLWERGLPPDHETIADVRAEVDRLDSLVNRLLLFSRGESGPRRPVDLADLVRELARSLEPLAAAAGVAIRLDLDPRCASPVGDRDGLFQAIRNLGLNAIQAMPDGGQLSLTVRRGDTDSQAVVEVTDTGPGLSAPVRSHLFEPFFTTRSDGTGLGLAIAREIVLGHHGEIRALATTLGTPGTTFLVTLPATRGA